MTLINFIFESDTTGSLPALTPSGFITLQFIQDRACEYSDLLDRVLGG